MGAERSDGDRVGPGRVRSRSRQGPESRRRLPRAGRRERSDPRAESARSRRALPGRLRASARELRGGAPPCPRNGPARGGGQGAQQHRNRVVPAGEVPRRLARLSERPRTRRGGRRGALVRAAQAPHPRQPGHPLPAPGQLRPGAGGVPASAEIARDPGPERAGAPARQPGRPLPEARRSSQGARDLPRGGAALREGSASRRRARRAEEHRHRPGARSGQPASRSGHLLQGAVARAGERQPAGGNAGAPLPRRDVAPAGQAGRRQRGSRGPPASRSTS